MKSSANGIILGIKAFLVFVIILLSFSLGGMTWYYYLSPNYVYYQLSQSFKNQDYELFVKYTNTEKLIQEIAESNQENVDEVNLREDFQQLAGGVDKASLADSQWDSVFSGKLNQDGDRYYFESTFTFVIIGLNINFDVKSYISNESGSWKLESMIPDDELSANSNSLGEDLGTISLSESQTNSENIKEIDIPYQESTTINNLSVRVGEFIEKDRFEKIGNFETLYLEPESEDSRLVRILLEVRNDTSDDNDFNHTDLFVLYSDNGDSFQEAVDLKNYLSFYSPDDIELESRTEFGFGFSDTLDPNNKLINVLYFEVPKDVDLGELAYIEYTLDDPFDNEDSPIEAKFRLK